MSIFQESVIKKFLDTLGEDKMETAYQVFQKKFSPKKIATIKTLKEEEYQDGFLRDLFVDVLGYTLKPDDNFNLVREFKNQSDGKKADGAILQENKAKAVIELKSTKTKDLKLVTEQAFKYKNNQPGCKYVITSNFQKLRFYIDYANEYEEFDLFRLSRQDFELLFLILCKDSILNDTPEKLKKESLSHEENVSKQLYADYSVFRKNLFENLTRNNPETDKLTLFSKTQTLIDRFLFILFAEDKGLLPPNSISRIIDRFNTLKEEDAYKPLYEIYKQYFEYMNTGRKGKSAMGDIPAYNGGLFYPDEILNSLKIDDDILINDLQKLSGYDFDTEVDVNILGHIFEHSLSEIEETTARIKGIDIDRAKTRRKKDGVFYTPQYITRYIVDNTIGRLCDDKRRELGIVEIEIDDDCFIKRGGLSKKGHVLDQKLEDYKNWLLSLKILDPACGSGAFLNQALSFLINEHNFIIEVQTDLNKGEVSLFNVENAVLENNLYGVDINAESVEITKLSLWLRTANRERKLSNLTSNIRCGNSLIDDPEIAGDKAFDWEKEFPEIIQNGGFHVVIGNPPYVNANDLKKNISKDEYKYLKSNYVTAKGTVDLYIYFFEKGLKLLKNKGYFSFITPNRFLSASYGKALREYLIENCQIKSLVDYSDKTVFQDASTYPVITILRLSSKDNYDITTGKFENETKELLKSKNSSKKLKILNDYILGFLLNDKLPIVEKIISQSVSLEEVGKINATSTASEADTYSRLIDTNTGYKLINTGTIDSYFTTWGINSLIDKGNKYLSPYLPKSNKLISENRHKLYTSAKIIIAKIGLKCESFYDKSGEYASFNTNCIHTFNKEFLPEYILCWLNSRLYNYLFECFFDGLRMSGGYLLYSSPNLRNTYIKKTSIENQKPFIEKADIMLSKNKELHELKTDFLNFLKSELTPQKITKKLENWNELDWEQLKKEMKKCKIKELSLKERKEWQDYFIDHKTKADTVKSAIDNTEREIDHMVYELYGLTQEEIETVETCHTNN